MARRARHDVVACERRHREKTDAGNRQLGGDRHELRDHRLVARLRVTDEVHLVDRDDDLRDAEQRGNEGMAARLREHAFGHVDEDHREVGGRRAGHHVARVLHVAGRVGDDEAAPRRREVPVRHVDGDLLLALGAQAVGHQRRDRSVRQGRCGWRARSAPAGRPGSRWSRRADGPRACSCRRRRCRPSGTAADPTRGASVVDIRSTRPACDLPSPCRSADRRAVRRVRWCATPRSR